jgi:hypothetical protein
MDTGQADQHLGARGAGGADPVPRRRRRLLFAALLALGLAYVGAFAFFLARSVDFVARQQREAAIAAAGALALRLPATLAFGADGNGAALLGQGWHRPESGGTWTRSREAFVHLPAAARGAGWLEVEFDAHVDPRRGELGVDLDLDGAPVATWRPTRGAATVRARVPLPESGATATAPTLRLRVDRPRSPRQNGAGPGGDGRVLGIHLKQIRLEPPDPPGAAP